MSDLLELLADLVVPWLDFASLGGEGWRWSRVLAVLFGLAAMVCAGVAVFALGLRLEGTLGAVGFGALAWGSWQAGNWWDRRSYPKRQPRGFEVIHRDRRVRRVVR